VEEASDLSVILRAGSLSVPVVIEEERTVGPALGADSIRRGVRAMITGLVAIILFTALYYRVSGLYASVALAANLLLLIGVMSMFEATLTLPGIAGIVLTVGMAVDANVIIFERIREELRAHKTPRAAISTGFSKAYWTIMDANLTTLGTAIVLYNYGTGPIKGFAVTLSIGVVTSVFAALVITRLMFAVFPGDRHVESLSI
jgi:preprotein translocase subunit SecD